MENKRLDTANASLETPLPGQSVIPSGENSGGQFGLPATQNLSNNPIQVHSQENSLGVDPGTVPLPDTYPTVRRRHRKAMIVSSIITLIVVLITGASILYFARKNADRLSPTINQITTQDVTLQDAELTGVPQEIVGIKQSLLVNGDVITRGELKISNGNYVTVVKVQDQNANQTFILPNSSGTICVDSNNCGFVTLDQLQQLQNQLGQVAVPEVPPSSLVNNQNGAVVVQGTTNQVIVTNGSGTITLASPQDLAQISSPTFAGLVLNGNLSLTGTITLPLNCSAQINGGALTTNGSGQVICSDDDGGAGGGNVTTTVGGTAGSIPVFTTAQNIENSLLAQALGTVTVSGNLSVTGTMTITQLATFNGGVTVQPGDTLTFNGDAFTDLTGSGLQVSAGILNLNVQANKGLEVDGNGLSLIDCALNEVLKYNGSNQWACAPDTDTDTGAPDSAAYVTVGNNGSLSAERSINPTGNLTGTDGGANGNYSINTVANPTFTTSVTTPLLQSSGALSITPGGALSIGATGQTALLQGSITTITSNGAGNDIVLTSADQIRLTGFNCTSFANGGVLTTDASGNIACDNDNGDAATGITGTGNANRLALFTGAQTVADSWLLQNGSTLELDNTRDLSLTGGNFSVTGTGIFSGLLTANGSLTVQTGDTLTFNGDAFTDLTGTGLQISTGSLQTTLGTSVDLTSEVTGILPVANGGTGVNGSSAANGQLLIGNGTGYTLATLTQGTGITISNGSGTITIASTLGTTIESAEITDLTVTGADIADDTIALGTKTTGNYVAEITAGNGISGSSSTEGGTPTLALGALSANWNQTGAFDISLNNAGSELRILESAGATFFGTLDVGDLGADVTYTLPNASANQTICTIETGNCAGSGTGVTTPGGITNQIAKFTGAQSIDDSTLSDDGTNVTTTVDLVIQGGSATLGTISQAASMVLHDGDGETITLTLPDVTASYSLVFPDAVGGANQCLKAQNGTGTLFWDNCLGGTGGGGITSVDGQTGPAITINNATGAANAITIDNADADGTTKGIAAFNATNFTAASGVINTAQGISTSATPSFAGLSLTGNLNMNANTIQGTTAVIDFTNFDVASNGNVTAGTYNSQDIDATANFTGTLTVAGLTTLNGNLTLEAGDTLTFNGDAFTDLTGDGLQVTGNALVVRIETNKGLEVDGNGLSLINCGDQEILKYETSGNTWFCAPDAGGSGTGDDVLIGGVNATNANFIDTTASASVAGVDVSLNTAPSPDEISITISDASNTLAGIVTANAQTFGGAKTFNGQIVAAAGVNLSTQTLQGTTAVIDFNNFDVSSAGAVTAVGVNAGSGLLQGTGGLTVTGTVTLSSLTNGFLEVNGSGVVSVGTIDLGTDTNGNYVATITAGNGISGSSSTEGGTPTIALSNLTADWLQSGAFDVTLDNSSSELKIRESSGAFYAILDVADLSGDQTFTFNEGGTVVTTGNVASHATTGVTAGLGLTGGGTVGVLTLNIGAGNGVTVNANDITLALQANKGLEVDANGLSLIDCATDEVLKYNASNQWVCAPDAGGAGVGDDVSVNGTGATNANFLNTSATGSAAGTTWSLNTVSNPDDITLAISTASNTLAGIVDINAQTFGGAKTFNGQIVAAAGVNLGTQTLQGTTAVIDFNNFDVSSAGAVTAVGVNAGSGLLQGTGGLTVGGTVTLSSLTNGFLEVNGAGVVSVGTIDLGTDTNGNYVATITSGNGVSAAATGEGSTPTVNLADLTGDWLQAGAFDITLDNSSSELKIRESSGAFYAIFDVADLTADQTFTFDQGGTVVTNNNISTYATTAVTAGNGLTGGGTVGALTLDIVSANGGIVANANNIALTLQANKGLEVDSNGLSLIDCANNQILKYETTGNTWGCAADAGGAGVGDNVQVNGTAVNNDVNILNTSATAAIAATTWTLVGGSPDQLTVAIGAASATEGGIITANAQTFSGAKTFNGQIVAGAGVNLGTQTLQGTTAVIDFNNFDVSSAGAVTAVGVNAGSGLLQGTGGLTVSGTVTLSSLTNGFLEVNGSGVVSVGTIDLGADTTGNYVAEITAGNGISGSSSTEGGTPTLALGALSANWNQTGAFDISLNNAGSELRILESAGATFFGTLDVGDLGADVTYTLPNASANQTICTIETGNCAGSGTGVTTPGGITNQIAKFTGAQSIDDSTLSDDGTNVTTTVDLVIQGGSATLGTISQAASMVLHDGDGETITLTLPDVTASYSLVFPDAVGGANQCLKAQNGTGTLFWDNCLGGTGGGGITSVDGQTGPAITINNATGAANAITIDNADADGTTKGIAAFNATNFTAASGVINTAQGISTSATPSFAGLSLTGNLNMNANTIQGTTAVIDFTNFDVASNGNVTAGTYNSQDIDATANFTGTLTVAGLTTLNGNLTLEAGDTLTFNGDAFTDLTGDGLQVTGNALVVRLDTTAADGSTTSSVSGLEIAGGELTLIRGCADGEILKWDNTNFEWDCATDAGGGSGDNISVNGTAAADANFIDTAASATLAATTFTLNAGPTPDTVALNIGAASATEAGIITANAQTIGGAKTFNGQITAAAGIDLAAQTLSGTTAVINFNNFDVSSAGAVTAVGVNAGSGLLQGTGGLTVSGTVTLSSLTNGFLEVNGSGVVSVGTIDLGTDTAGNYVATITSGNGVSAAATGEGSTPTINLADLTGDWLQAGAFDITLDNSSSELKIRESSGAFYAIFDVADLSADQTFTFNQGGTVVTSGNVASHATTGVTAGLGLAGGGTVGVLTLDIASANGGIVVNASDIALTLQANKGLEVDSNGLSLIDCANNQILKYETSGNTWACAPDAGGAGVGDDVQVAGTDATGANFLDTTASASVAGVDVSLNTVPAVDEISITISDASATLSGIITANAQTFGGAKTFNGQIVAGAGINLGSQTLQGTTAIVDFTNFDVSSGGNVTAVGTLDVQGASVTVGAAALQGSLIINDGDGETATITIDDIAVSGTFRIPNTASTSDTFCLLTLANCAGAGSGVTATTPGTAGRLAVFTTGQNIGDSWLNQNGSDIEIDNTKNLELLGGNLSVTGTGSFTSTVTIQGASATIGTTSVTGNLILHDGNGQTTTLTPGDSAGNLAFILPTSLGSASQCLKNSATPGTLTFANCNNGSGAGGAITLQDAYDAGNTINTTTGRNITITLQDLATDQTFEITQAGAADAFRVNDDGTLGDTTAFVIDQAGNVNIGGTLNIQGAATTIGAAALQGSLVINDGDGETVTITIDDITASGTFKIPDTASTSDTFCLLTLANCVGTGGGVTESGTNVSGQVAYFTSDNNITSSSAFTFNGTDLTLTNDLNVNGDDIFSDGNLSIQATGYIRIGDTGTPGVANGDDDLYVEGDLEADGITNLGGALTVVSGGATVTAGDLALTAGNLTTGGTQRLSNAGALSNITGYSQTSGTFAFSGAGNFSLDSSAFDVTTAGALSGITGYAQSSGNFLQSGAGTFGTGTGVVSLNGATDVAATASLATKAGATYTTAGSANNVAISTASLYRLDTSGAAQTITGIVAGRDGQILTLVNADAATSVTVTNLDAASSAANQISTGTGASITLAPGASSTLVYDATSSLWRVVGGVAGGNGTCSGCANTTLSNLGATNINAALNATSANLTLQTTTSGNIVLNGAGFIDLQDNVNVAGTIANSGGNVVLADTVDLGSATLGIRVAAADGAISDIDGDIILNDQVQVGGANGLQITTAGVITDLNDASVTVGENLTVTAGGITVTAGDLALTAGNLTTGGTQRLSNAGALSNITGYSQTSGTFAFSGAGNFSLDSSAFDVTTAGALSGITGYAQSSGNFLQSGAGTFGTGTGVVSLNGATDVAATASLATKAGATYTTAGSANNVAISTASLYRLDTSGAAQTITGIVAGRDGQILTLVNADAATSVTVTNLDAASSAANQISTGTGASITLAPGASSTLVYDATSSLWRVVGGVAGGNGTCSGCANTTLSNLGATNINAALNATSANLTLQTTTSGNIVLNGAGFIDLQDNVNVAGTIANSGGNVVLADTVDLGSATLGIRVAAADGAISDIDGDIILNDQVQVGGANGLQITTAGVITDLNDASVTVGENLTVTAGGITVTAGDLALTAGNLTTGGTQRLSNAGALSNITGYSQTSGTFAFSGAGNFSLDSSAFDVTTAGALSGITGYAQSSGNFLQSGAGTFGTGTGVVSLNGATDVAATASLATKAGATYTTAGSANNVAISTASLYRLDTSGAAQTITGIVAGRDGQILTLVNADAATSVTVTNLDAASSAANQISTGTGASITLAPGASSTLVYDATSSLWRVVGGVAGGNGTCSGCANTTLSNLGATNINAALNATSANLTLQTTTSGNIVLNGAGFIDLQDNVNVAGTIANSGGNVVLADTVDLGSATLGIRVAAADGAISDIDGDIILNDQVQVGGANGLQITTAGVITDLNDASVTVGENLTVTAGGITVTAGDLALTAGNLTTGGTQRLSNAGALSNITGYSQTSGTFAFSGAGNFSLDSSAFDVTTAGAVSGVTTLNTSGIITLGALGSTDTDSYVLCRDASSGQLTACDANASGDPFIQGGNTFGAQAILGTNDSNSLAFETNNGTKLVLDTTGNLAFQQASTISTTAGALTLQPVAGSNLNVSLSTTGDFVVNTNQLYVDTSTAFVGIGDTSPDAKLEIIGTTEQLRLSNVDDTQDARFTVDSSGNLTINTGGTAGYTRIGDTGTPGVANGDDDLYVEGDLEADGITNLGGALTVVSGGATVTAGDLALTAGNLTTGGTQRLSNAGALSNITGYSQTSGTFAFSGAGNFSLDSSAFDVTTAGAVSGVTTLNTSGIITLGSLAAADTDSYVVCRDASTTQLSACDANTTGRPFLQNGNSFGAQAVLGTNDSFGLALETVNVQRLTVDTSGNIVTLGGNLTVQDASANSAFFFDATNSVFRVYENVGSPSNYAEISFSGGAAIFAASSGNITQVGNGSGHINLQLTGTNDQLLASKTNTPAGAYSLSDFNFTRTITGGNNAITGTVLKVEDLSTFTGGSSAPTVLLVNQNNTSATGNLLLLQSGGTNEIFKVATAGATTLKNTTNSTAALNVQNAAGTSVFDVDTTNGRIGIGDVTPNAQLDIDGSLAGSAGWENVQTYSTLTVTPSSGSVADTGYFAMRGKVTTTSTNLTSFDTIIGVEGYASNSGTDTLGTARGLSGWIENTSSGSITDARTLSASLGVFGGSITNAYGGYFDTPLVSGGTITNSTGIHIQNQGGSGITNATGLFVATQSGASGTNYAAIFQGGNVGIGTTSPSRTLTVTGNWGGNVVATSTSNSSTTSTISTPALAYYVESTDTTGSCDTSDKIFNITGLPDTEGTFAFISSKATDNDCTSGTQIDVTVQINGTTISTLINPVAGASDTTTENYTVVRINGAWRIVGATSSVDGADLAENFPVAPSEGLVPGELVSFGSASPSGDSYAVRSNGAYDSKLMGIVSTQPGITLDDGQGYEKVVIALAGRVPTLVSEENGPIAIGDPITASSTPGVGMKATQAGQIVGYAMVASTGPGQSMITVKLASGFWAPEIADTLQADAATFSSMQVTGSANIGSLNVSGATTLARLTVTGDAIVQGNLTVSGNIEVANLYVNGQLISKGPVPQIAPGAVLGSVLGATTGVSGTDGAGTITITIGANVPSGGELAEVTFDSPYANAPRIVISGNNKKSAKLGAYIIRTTTGFKIVSDDPLEANTMYEFDYIVIGAENP